MNEHNDKNNIKYLFSFILIICLIYVLYLLITNLYFEIIKLDHNSHQILVERLKVEKEEAEEEKRDLKYIKEMSGYNVIAELEIPAIDLNMDILEEYSEESLRVSITKFFGSNPNEIGNFCISGHNYRINNKSMFSRLRRLQRGDEIFLTDGYEEKVKYKVYDIFKVLPHETNSLSQKTKGKREMTLITCTSDSKQRIIVKAIEVEEI